MCDDEREIEVRWVQPNRRLVCEEAVLLAACRDIACQGQQAPITVEFAGSWFRILDGEVRWRACCKCGLKTVKAVIVSE